MLQLYIKNGDDIRAIQVDANNTTQDLYIHVKDKHKLYLNDNEINNNVLLSDINELLQDTILDEIYTNVIEIDHNYKTYFVIKTKNMTYKNLMDSINFIDNDEKKKYKFFEPDDDTYYKYIYDENDTYIYDYEENYQENNSLNTVIPTNINKLRVILKTDIVNDYKCELSKSKTSSCGLKYILSICEPDEDITRQDIYGNSFLRDNGEVFKHGKTVFLMHGDIRHPIYDHDNDSDDEKDKPEIAYNKKIIIEPSCVIHDHDILNNDLFSKQIVSCHSFKETFVATKIYHNPTYYDFAKISNQLLKATRCGEAFVEFTSSIDEYLNRIQNSHSNNTIAECFSDLLGVSRANIFIIHIGT